jgi:hypothetical protein
LCPIIIFRAPHLPRHVKFISYTNFTAVHGKHGPKILGQAGLVRRAGVGPNFGARTSDSDLQKTQFKPSLGKPGFWQFRSGSGLICKPEGQAGPSQARAWEIQVGLFQARPSLRNAQV